MKSNDTLRITLVSWRNAETELADIRRRVFIDEQQVPEELEWDGLDADATHVIAHQGEAAIACGRLLADGHIGRMAVLPTWREQGIGRRVLDTLIDAACARGDAEVFLHAQTNAIGFYEKAGFIAEGPAFMDAGIPHRTMRRTLRQPG